MKREGRFVVLAGMVAVALAGVLSVTAQDAPGTATPSASPVASPAASPVAPGGLTGDIERGKQLAAQCIGCHTVDGSTMVGPSWKGIYGSTVELEDGTTVTVDDAYLIQSMQDPLSQVVKGFPPVMPPYSWLSDQDKADLVAYIESLK